MTSNVDRWTARQGREPLSASAARARSRLPRGRVIARFRGTKEIGFTVPSQTGLGDRHYQRVRDLEYDVGNARICGGIDYRSAVEDGIAIARKTANQVLAHNFQRSKR